MAVLGWATLGLKLNSATHVRVSYLFHFLPTMSRRFHKYNIVQKLLKWWDFLIQKLLNGQQILYELCYSFPFKRCMLLCAIQFIENKNEPLRNSNIVGIIHVFNIYVRYDKTTCFLHVDMMFSLNKATILKITKHKEITRKPTYIKRIVQSHEYIN